MYLIVWDKVTIPNCDGGLSISVLNTTKVVLFAKMVITCLNKVDSLWANVDWVKYGDVSLWGANVLFTFCVKDLRFWTFQNGMGIILISITGDGNYTIIHLGWTFQDH